MPALPTFIIIGAAKCGTTSLHHYLSFHDEIFMTVRKELSYFSGQNSNKGEDWYKSNFNENYKVRGESSPWYTRSLQSAVAAQKIASTVPDVKIIFLIRDPIDRILSKYVDLVHTNMEFRSFDEIMKNIEFDDEQYVQDSLYFLQLSYYLEHFRRENIFIGCLEDMAADPRQFVGNVLEFLSVSTHLSEDAFVELKNSGEHKKQWAKWAQNKLPKFLANELRHPGNMPWPIVNGLNTILSIGGKTFGKPSLTEDDLRKFNHIFRDDFARIVKEGNLENRRWRYIRL